MNSELCYILEDGAINIALSVAATYNARIAQLEWDEDLRAARQDLAMNPEDVFDYLHRARELYSAKLAPGYCSPNDLSLAGYIYLIDVSTESKVLNFIDSVANDQRAGFDFSAYLSSALRSYSIAGTEDLLSFDVEHPEQTQAYEFSDEIIDPSVSLGGHYELDALEATLA